jgi:hypothetical protein
VASRSPLDPWEQAHASWALPIVAAGIAGALLGGAAPLGAESQRSVAFALGPAVMLVTLHARTASYLHDEGLAATLPLPIAPVRRFAAAQRRHLVGLAWQGAWGAIAFAIAGADMATRLVLVLDWLALVVMCALVEPVGAAASAWMGRRVPPESVAGQLQRSLGGGWTLPEAVVHLWAPAIALSLAAASAMPLQLAIDRWADAQSVASTHLVACAVAIAIAVVLRLIAPVIYARGVFDAVPWLRQAMRTLAGPPTPQQAPRWIAAIRDPALRLALLQHQRLTPVPMLRLAMLVGTALVLTFKASVPDLAQTGILAGLVALWLVPATALQRHAAAKRRLFAPLPIRDARGRALACLLAPVAVAVVPVAIRIGGAT